MADHKLTVKQKLGFGIFDLGGNLFFTLMSFWTLKYLTDTVGMGPALAGTALMVSKIWDAVIDPPIGYISDRTLSRWGRRRVYLLFGAIPMMLAMFFFFTSPTYLPSSMHFVWAIVALVLLNTATSITNIPYSSLTPELTDDYHEQSSLNGYRFSCAVFGTLAGAAAVQPLVQIFAKPGASDPLKDPRGFSMMGLILGGIMALVTILTFLGTKEKPHTKENLPKENFFKTYLAVFKNKPYVILLLTYTLHMIGFSFLTTILAYYTEYVLFRPDITTIAMAILLVTAMIFIPVSVQVSKKFGKKITYQVFFVIVASACLVLYFFGHHMPLGLFFAVMVYAGIGVGFCYVAPFAMIPDTIEYEAFKTGQRKEGPYYGMWTFIAQGGMALAGFLSGHILKLGGYIATAGEAVDQPETVFNAVRLIVGPIPAAVLLGAFILITFYPLNEKTHKELLDKEKEKNG